MKVGKIIKPHPIVDTAYPSTPLNTPPPAYSVIAHPKLAKSSNYSSMNGVGFVVNAGRGFTGVSAVVVSSGQQDGWLSDSEIEIIVF
jgi:hypothetical protein